MKRFQESSRSCQGAWRAAQGALWLIGAGLILALLLAPDVGLHAFWNVLIPVAPALLAFAPGAWRNVCPLGTTGLLARHLGLCRRRKLSEVWRGRLGLAGVAALLFIVPLRHVVLDTSGPATALAVALVALAAISMGTVFEWKSGWCSSLCPVHPVEKLYGAGPAFTAPNAHCTACERCVAVCPDATPDLDPFTGSRTTSEKLAAITMVGGFPGFIWGWFHVPDYAATEGWQHLAAAYGWPLAGFLGTLVLFLATKRYLPGRLLTRLFAASAIACYYYYRLPALVGFGISPGDGMLVDLRGTLPPWAPAACRIATTTLLFWWLALRSNGRRSWQARPTFAVDAPLTRSGEGSRTSERTWLPWPWTSRAAPPSRRGR